MSPLPVEFLRSAVEEWPTRTALSEDGLTLTYAQLWEQSSPFDVEAGRAVVLFTEGGSASVRALWSTLRAGAVAVELNPTLHDDDLRAVLDATDPAGAVIAPAHRERLARLCSLPELVGGGVEVEVQPEDLASLVFTSGTTGTPKGVRLSHANLGAVTSSIAASFGLARGAAERLAGNLPLYYTYGRSVVLLAAHLGASVVFTQRALTAKRLFGLCRDQGVTHLSLVPYLAAGLLRVDAFRSANLPDLGRITVAGGAVAATTRDELCARFPGRVWPLYGLTEASTRLTCLSGELLASHPDSCGRAIPGVELAIWSEEGQPLPTGEVGEVVARGPNVTAGYYGDPALSAATLRGGWLRTGDLGRLDAEGFLSVEGRLKDVIKCMGQRLVGRALEDVVLELESVAEAAAVGVPDLQRGEAVALFVVLSAGAELDAGAIRERIVARYGSAAVPISVSVVEALPRTGSGKVRKGELRERHLGAAE